MTVCASRTMRRSFTLRPSSSWSMAVMAQRYSLRLGSTRDRGSVPEATARVAPGATGRVADWIWTRVLRFILDIPRWTKAGLPTVSVVGLNLVVRNMRPDVEHLGAAGAGVDVAGFGDVEDGGGVAAVDCARGGNYRVKISSSSGELDINRFSSRAGAGASGATGAAHSYWRERRRTSAGSRPAISDLQTCCGSFLKCSGQVSIKSC